jgi:hypothetical protein
MPPSSLVGIKGKPDELRAGVIRLRDEVAKLARVVPWLVETADNAGPVCTDDVDRWRDSVSVSVMTMRRLSEFFAPTTKRRKRDLAPDDFVPNFEREHKTDKKAHEAGVLREYFRQAAKTQDRLTWDAALGAGTSEYECLAAAGVLISLCRDFAAALHDRDPDLAQPLCAAVHDACVRLTRTEVVHDARASRLRDGVAADTHWLMVTRFDQAKTHGAH